MGPKVVGDGYPTVTPKWCPPNWDEISELRELLECATSSVQISVHIKSQWTISSNFRESVSWALPSVYWTQIPHLEKARNKPFFSKLAGFQTFISEAFVWFFPLAFPHIPIRQGFFNRSLSFWKCDPCCPFKDFHSCSTRRSSIERLPPEDVYRNWYKTGLNRDGLF